MHREQQFAGASRSAVNRSVVVDNDNARDAWLREEQTASPRAEIAGTFH